MGCMDSIDTIDCGYLWNPWIQRIPCIPLVPWIPWLAWISYDHARSLGLHVFRHHALHGIYGVRLEYPGASGLKCIVNPVVAQGRVRGSATKKQQNNSCCSGQATGATGALRQGEQQNNIQQQGK